MNAMVLMALALSGAIISAYVWYKQVTTGPVLCIGSGCAAVIRSPFGRLLGIPNGALGVGYFLYIALVPWLQTRTPQVVMLATVVTGIALPLYLYLTYLQFFVLRALCSWCLASAAITALILLVMIA